MISSAVVYRNPAARRNVMWTVTPEDGATQPGQKLVLTEQICLIHAMSNWIDV